MDDMRMLILALGAYFLGAVYLAGLIAIGIASGDRAVIICALASAALGYFVQVISVLFGDGKLGAALWVASVTAAALGGALFVMGA